MEFGKYRLLRTIARGGMAELYLAIQRGPQGFEKVLVLKCVLPELCQVHDFVQMFLDEARLAAHLDHNNVVRVYDFGEVDGQYYLAMEYLPGEDLASVVQMARRSQKQLPVETVADIAIGALMGLNFAHELIDARGRPLNIVHRDVSPSNIIVTYHGVVKLVDFGIARAETNVQKTSAGMLKGKFAYVSPEQVRGTAVDCRSDIFALGAVLYELLTGARLFKRDSDLATLNAVIEGPIERPSRSRKGVPPLLDDIVIRALTREVNERYQTAGEMADDLSAFLVNQGYVRSERRLADFISGLFGEQRKMGKLRVAQASLAEADADVQTTPSVLKNLPKDLSPLRGRDTGQGPAIPPDYLRDNETAPATVAETKPQPKRAKPWLVAVVAGGVMGLAAVAAYVFLRTPSSPASLQTLGGPVALYAPPPAALPLPPSAPSPAPAPAPGAPNTEVAPPPAAPAPVAATAPQQKKAVARGKLTLDTSPWAEVFLNGRKLGDTPLINVSLPAGRYTLTLVNDSRNIHSAIEVVVEPGKTTVKKLSL
jgi:serine/threonine protein kinase